MLQPGQAGRLVAQVASALGAAHAKGLMHRDVKPANVLVASVDNAEHAYLTDFGIARLEHATSRLTQTGAVVGTIDYMPPERIEGAAGDARSDVYSLGCLLYETLTGQPPFVRENQGARMYAHLSAEVPSATDSRPEVPQALSDVAMRAMAKQPEDRFQSAGEMARAVHAAVSARSTEAMAQPPEAETVRASTAPPATATTTAIRERRRPPRAVPAVGALVVVALVGAVLLALGGGEESKDRLAPSGVPIPVPSQPDGLAAGAGSIWVAGAEGDVVSRIEWQSRPDGSG